MPKKISGTFEGTITDDGKLEGVLKGTATDVVVSPPPPPPPPVPVESASGTQVVRPRAPLTTTPPIYDRQLAGWTLQTINADKNGEVFKGNALAGYTANAKSLQYIDGVISHTNDANDTYEWKNNDWALKVVTAPPPPPPPVPSNKLLVGVNLSGMETWWRLPGNGGANDSAVYPPSLQFVKHYADRGCNVLRIPFLWEIAQPTLGGPLAQKWTDVFDAFIAEGEKYGVTIMLDMHNNMHRDTGHNFQPFNIIGQNHPTATAAVFAAAWAKIAARYRDKTNVIFNLMNEPFDQGTAKLDYVKYIATTNAAIKAIRDIGCKQLIAVGATGGSWGFVDQGRAAIFKTIVDPGNNWCIDIHQYFDGAGGFQDQCVPNTAFYMDECTRWGRENKIRFFCGEFGSGVGSNCPPVLAAVAKKFADGRDVWIGWTAWNAGAPEMQINYPLRLTSWQDGFKLDQPRSADRANWKTLQPFADAK